MDLLLLSSLHAQAGRWRESADAYREFYESVCESTHEYRFYAISGFTSILREGQTVATSDDLSFLKTSFKNKKLQVCDRSMMGFTYGFCLFMCSRRDEAVKMYRKVIAMTISAEERAEKIFMDPHSSKTAGEVFDGNVKDAQDNLAGLLDGDGGRRIHGDKNSQRCSSQSMTVPDDLPDELRDFILQAGLYVKGSRCDNCQKEAEKKLKMCYRCKRKYYCDETCQRAHWKVGQHKISCRDVDQFLLNDIVRLQGLASKPELNGVIVSIKERATTEGRWIVTKIRNSEARGRAAGEPKKKNTDGILSVNEKNLCLLLTCEEYKHLLPPPSEDVGQRSR